MQFWRYPSTYLNILTAMAVGTADRTAKKIVRCSVEYQILVQKNLNSSLPTLRRSAYLGQVVLRQSTLFKVCSPTPCLNPHRIYTLQSRLGKLHWPCCKAFCDMSHVFLCQAMQLLTLLACVTSMRADYFIDDSNTMSIQYTPWSEWSPFNQSSLGLAGAELPNGTLFGIGLDGCWNHT